MGLGFGHFLVKPFPLLVSKFGVPLLLRMQLSVQEVTLDPQLHLMVGYGFI